ncbi:MAG: CoA transferase [Pseudomonadales bacterium]|nr:CoA transferase [Pseudomonadales bacterium]
MIVETCSASVYILGMGNALKKYRICDFTGQLAGAGATKWLSAFGAEIIRIEDPVRDGRWDILRGMAPFKDGQSGLEFGGGFNNHNTDKLGITLNLREDKAKEILTEIIKISDAVTENFAAGVLDKWGFGYEELKAIKPDIIYVSNCGFGHVGPYHEYKTWGPIVQAVSGLTFSSTLPNQPPAGWGYSYMDHTGGYYMAMSILLALIHREKTGEGQWVDLACTEAATTLNGPALLDWTVNGKPMRQDVQTTSNRSQYQDMAPHGIYPCQGEDHWIAISCRHDTDWQKLATVIDADWTGPFEQAVHRVAHQDELDQKLISWTQNADKFELQTQLRALPIPAAAVLKPAERIDEDPSTARFGLWPTVEHTAIGKARVDGLPVHFSDSDWHMARGAPCLSEHTKDVLTRLLGYDDLEISELYEQGVL